MKSRICVSLLAVLMLVGCSASAQLGMKKNEGSIWGLKRKITLYDAIGAPIKQWETTTSVDDKGGTVYFLDANGKAVTVSGTFIIEEQ